MKRRWQTTTFKRSAVLGAVALLAILASFAVSQANHPAGSTLEVTPEPVTAVINSNVVLTARLRDSNGMALVNPGPGNVRIDFEIETGPNNPDGNTPTEPDKTCLIAPLASTCTVTFTSPAAGTNLIRAWIDHDGSDFSVEADPTEGRFSGITDCTPDDPPACPSTTVEAGAKPERDDTDVVSITWTTAPATLDCDDSSGNDREIKPILTNETYICTALDAQGNPVAGVRVDGENMDGVNDPDNADAGPADYNDFCITGASGTCMGTISGAEGQQGVAFICLWADTDNDNAYDKNSLDENDGGKCDEESFDAPENNNLTDVVRLTWRPVSNTQIVAEGTTRGATTFLLLANSSTSGSTIVDVTFLTENGPRKPEVAEEVTLAAGRRLTINMNTALGVATDAGARIFSYGQPVVAEVSIHRTGSLATVDTIGVAGTTAGLSTASLWLVPEGATHSGFTTFVDVVNPDPNADTQVNVTCLPANSAAKAAQGTPLTVPRGSRRTMNMNTACNLNPGDDVSTRVQVVPPPDPLTSPKPNVVVGMTIENSTLAPDLGVGGSVGVTGAADTWVVPEGATHSGWQTFVLVVNPGTSDATVNITYLTKSQGAHGDPNPLTIPAGRRRTIDVNSRLAEMGLQPDDVSTLIDSTAGTVAVESTIQKSNASGFVIADSVGSPGANVAEASGTKWMTAEGATHFGFTTFILIANPDTTNPATVNVTFLTPGGSIPYSGNPLVIPAGNRRTITVNSFVPGEDVSTLVEASSGKVVVGMSIDRIVPGVGFSKGWSLAFRLAA